MEHTSTLLSEAVRSVHLLKIDGFLSGAVTYKIKKIPRHHRLNSEVMTSIFFRCSVSGYQWETRFYPSRTRDGTDRWVWVALELVFLGEAGTNKVTANISCRLVDPSGNLGPSEETVSETTAFQRASDCSQPVWIMRTCDVEESGYLKSGSLTVECAITVFRDVEAIPLPDSDLPQHLGELLRSEARADVTFHVSGKTFAAHRNIVNARSPELMIVSDFSELDGPEMIQGSPRVKKIRDMEAEVFQALLHFVYTGRVPEIDGIEEAAATMAQHLMAAAHRYKLGRLKAMCERRLSFGINVSTAAATLALAEQYGCLQLKAKCIEFISGGSPETLDAVLATEGYKGLEASSPSVVTELLKAAHGKTKEVK